jgi:hypothetical protein
VLRWCSIDILHFPVAARLARTTESLYTQCQQQVLQQCLADRFNGLLTDSVLGPPPYIVFEEDHFAIICDHHHVPHAVHVYVKQQWRDMHIGAMEAGPAQCLGPVTALQDLCVVHKPCSIAAAQYTGKAHTLTLCLETPCPSGP